MAKENLNPLKTLVFSMGLLLVGGTVLLGALVWKKVSAETSGAPIAQCAGGHVDLKGHGAVVDSMVDGNVMRMIFAKSDTQEETVTLDMCSGKILGSLVIDSDADYTGK